MSRILGSSEDGRRGRSKEEGHDHTVCTGTGICISDRNVEADYLDIDHSAPNDRMDDQTAIDDSGMGTADIADRNTVVTEAKSMRRTIILIAVSALVMIMAAACGKSEARNSSGEQKKTVVQTEKVTEKLTEKMTEKQTEEVTEKTLSKSTSSSSSYTLRSSSSSSYVQSNNPSTSTRRTYTPSRSASYDDSYDSGYDAVMDDDDYDWDRYQNDVDYASGVDDAMEDYDDEYGEEW